MPFIRSIFIQCSAVIALTLSNVENGRSAEVRSADVVVYGATSAGIAAAIQTVKMGHTVIVLEPSQHIGGLTAGGLGMTDSGEKSVIGGLSREFYQRIKKHYSQPSSWRWERQNEYKPWNESLDALWRFEPSVAEKVYEAWLAEHKISVIKGQSLDLTNWGKKEGTAIVEIKMESGAVYRGQRFIDASYEGDLMAKAGVSFHVGREANSTYEETLNGIQFARAVKHQFLPGVDPYVVPGDPSSGLLWGVSPDKPGPDGSADHRVQAFNFRLCLTDVPDNRLPFRKPTNYDPKHYELLRRDIAKGFRQFWNGHHMMPNRKSDTNNNGGFSSDFLGANYEYPTADHQTRQKIWQAHADYQMGMWYFLANDPLLPEEVRRDVSKWGLAKDEFPDHQGWPHQLYVREARRMISDWVQTEHDCRQTRATPESVGMGSYNMDSHNVQRVVGPTGFVMNEGDIQVSPGGPYPISYQAIRPKEKECSNLLVPTCPSGSHIAFGSIRMEPVFMVLGQSAGTAAVFSIQDKTSVQAVPYAKLKQRLEHDGQVLTFARKARSPQEDLHASQIDPRKLPGVVLDDSTALFEGAWGQSEATPGYVGVGYHHNQALGGKAEWTLAAPTTGIYQVGLAWTPQANRCRNVTLTITGATKEFSVIVDQTKTPKAKPFQPLGTISLNQGQKVTVSLSGPAASGHVIADAVQLLPVK